MPVNASVDVSPQARSLVVMLARQMEADVKWLISAKGYDRAELEHLIEELALAKLIEVHGAPNQNAGLGCDVERVELTALGYMSTGE